MSQCRTEMPVSNVERPTVHHGPGAPHIEIIQVERLTPYAGNARTHSKTQIRQIAKSIERFGHTNPILIDDGGQIIAGTGASKPQSSLASSPFQRCGFPTSRLPTSGLTSSRTTGWPKKPDGIASFWRSSCKPWWTSNSMSSLPVSRWVRSTSSLAIQTRQRMKLPDQKMMYRIPFPTAS